MNHRIKSFTKLLLLGVVLICLPAGVRSQERSPKATGQAPQELWPDRPGEFIADLKKRALEAADRGDVKELRSVFTEIVQKQIILEALDAPTLVDAKREGVLYLLNFEPVRTNKSSMLELANLIGKIRGQVIPGYTNRTSRDIALEVLRSAGVFNPSQLTNAADMKAYEQAIQKNKEDMSMNKLQRSLRSASEILAFHLLQNCKQIAKGANQEDFTSQVISSAKLSPEESSTLDKHIVRE